MNPGEDLVRRLYDARANGDVAAIRAILAPNIVWHEPVWYGGFAGDHAGIDRVFREVFDRYKNYDASGLDLHDVIAGDDHAVALVTWWARRGDEEIHGREVAVYHLRDGRIAEAWFHPDGDYRAFFA